MQKIIKPNFSLKCISKNISRGKINNKYQKQTIFRNIKGLYNYNMNMVRKGKVYQCLSFNRMAPGYTYRASYNRYIARDIIDMCVHVTSNLFDESMVYINLKERSYYEKS